MSIHAVPDERSVKRLGTRPVRAQRQQKARSLERALNPWWRWGDSGFAFGKSDPSLASSVGRNAKNAPLARFCPAGRVSTSSVRVPPLGLTGKYKKAGSLPNLRVYRGGDGGTRTPDPYVANVMLYQLSYIPMGTVFVRRLFCASLGCLSN